MRRPTYAPTAGGGLLGALAAQVPDVFSAVLDRLQLRAASALRGASKEMQGHMLAEITRRHSAVKDTLTDRIEQHVPNDAAGTRGVATDLLKLCANAEPVGHELEAGAATVAVRRYAASFAKVVDVVAGGANAWRAFAQVPQELIQRPNVRAI